MREAQKNGGHKLYEWLRSKEKPDTISPERFEYEAKEMEMRELYHKAFLSFFQRSQASKTSDDTTPDFNTSIAKLSALVPVTSTHSEARVYQCI